MDAAKWLLCSLCLMSCASGIRGGLLDWFRGSKGHRVQALEIEVLDPKGLRIWAPYNPSTLVFGIELYINIDGTGEALGCALCKNTSVPVHGKFLIEEDNVMIVDGDILEYVVVTYDGESVLRHKPQKVIVNDYLIKPVDRCRCSYRLPALHRGNISEPELLQRIILRMAARCSTGFISDWLLLQVESKNEFSKPMDYVRSYLSTGAPVSVQPYAASVVQAEEYNGGSGIAFRVKSTVDKLKILELNDYASDIVDYDGVTTVS